MSAAQTRAEIADLLKRHGLAPNHRLGQHFLADGNITRKIVALAAVGPGDRVVEVGAGTGTLTRALAESGARLISYEVDRGLQAVLKEVTADLSVELRFVDVMSVDLEASLPDGSWTMVANLPFNVGTPLILDVLRHVPQIVRLVVMVQKEVADRLVAKPGSRDYGLPSVVAGLHADIESAFVVPPQVFYPPPRVHSAVVVLNRRSAPPMAERAIEIAAAGFNQRRKMLRRSLDDVFEQPRTVLESAGIDPTARAEELDPADFLRLAET